MPAPSAWAIFSGRKPLPPGTGEHWAESREAALGSSQTPFQARDRPQRVSGHNYAATHGRATTQGLLPMPRQPGEPGDRSWAGRQADFPWESENIPNANSWLSTVVYFTLYCPLT